jgi:NADH-quinone oxidoreductase subunit H
VSSALVVTLFLGGWTFFGLENLGWFMGLVIFAAKTLFLLFTYIWVRWTLPRFRYDQLMALGWNVMLPVALSYIVIIATATLGLDAVGIARGPLFGLSLLVLNIGLLALLLRWLDKGKMISPASARVGGTDLARLRARGLARSRVALAEQRAAALAAASPSAGTD